MPGLKSGESRGGAAPRGGGLGAEPPHLQMAVILVGILMQSNGTGRRSDVEAEEGVLIRTWVEPGFEPVIIIILIVVIAIIVVIKMIIIISSSSLGFGVGRACVPGLKKKRGVEGGRSPPRGGWGRSPPICKWQ